MERCEGGQDGYEDDDLRKLIAQESEIGRQCWREYQKKKCRERIKRLGENPCA